MILEILKSTSNHLLKESLHPPMADWKGSSNEFLSSPGRGGVGARHRRACRCSTICARRATTCPGVIGRSRSASHTTTCGLPFSGPDSQYSPFTMSTLFTTRCPVTLMGLAHSGVPSERVCEEGDDHAKSVVQSGTRAIGRDAQSTTHLPGSE